VALKRRRRGEITSWDDPIWEPLETLLGIYVEEFMWMYAATLKDGTRVHGYKHRITRRYLHLSDEGRTFAWEEPDFYREVDTRKLVDLVMPARCDFSCHWDRREYAQDYSSES
jgi:hypothetical protein